MQPQLPIGKALDVSNNQGPITVDWLEKQHAKGFDRLIVGAGPAPYGNFTEQQIGAAVEHGGFGIEAYTYLEWGWDPVEWVRAALRATGDHEDAVSRWWTDIEDAKNIAKCPSLTLRIAYVDKALDEFTHWGVQSGIYTGAWFWIPYMANEPKWADRLLWPSQYEEVVLWSGCPWGWDKVALFQTAGSVNEDGISADVSNVYIVPEGEADMTPDQIKAQNDTALGLAALKLACFSGWEDNAVGMDQRFKNADYRIQQRVNGPVPDDGSARQDSLMSAIQSVQATIGKPVAEGSVVAGLSAADYDAIASRVAALLKIDTVAS